jgi:hypothetical protein
MNRKSLFASVTIAAVALTLWVGGCKTNDGNVTPTNNVPPEVVIPPVTPPVGTINCISVSGQSLVFDGKSVIIKGDTAWCLIENLAGNRAKVVKYFDARKGPVNAIMIGCNGRWFDKTVGKPNETLFSRLDATFADAEARGLFIILSPQITAYDNSGKPYVHVPREQSEQVGAYFGARYRSQRSLAWWMVGGADDKILSTSDLIAFASGIRKQDSAHIITYHPRAGRTTLDISPVGNLHQVVLYQSYHTYDQATHFANLKAMQNTGAPFANVEGPFDQESAETSANVVKVVQYAKQFPVCGFFYGNVHIYPFDSQWEASLNAAGFKGFINAIR